MRIFKDLDLVEHLGSGITRILKEYDRSIFVIRENFIRVTFMFDEDIVTVNESVNDTVNDLVNTNLSTVHQDIITELIRNKTITIEELAMCLVRVFQQ